MTLEQILEKMAEPEKLANPQEINTIVSYINGFITDLELARDEADIAYSLKWDEVRANGEDGKKLTNRETDVKMMRDGTYLRLQQTKRTLSELKRYRGTLNRKLDIIMNVRQRFGH
jgi:hypothetical protein